MTHKIGLTPSFRVCCHFDSLHKVCPGLTLEICDVNMDKSKYYGYLIVTAITT